MSARHAEWTKLRTVASIGWLAGGLLLRRRDA
jgi:hypothetical protein